MFAILYKLISEALLSFYPIFVKNINLSLDVQLWSRLSTYALIAFIFADKSFVLKYGLMSIGIGLAVINMIHIYTSYKAFQNLESGISYAIFYIYPLFILLLSGYSFHPIMLISIFGLMLIGYRDNNTEKDKKEDNDTEKDNDKKDKNIYLGIFMILIAAFTEALIYFIVKKIPTDNPWNHIFISYALGAVVATVAFGKKINLNATQLQLATLVNIVIGLVGYYLRFYTINKLTPITYASLSYFGIIAAYIYGMIFNKEIITIRKIIGTLMIIIGNIYMTYRLR